jgi:hypothetical protein
MRTEIPLLNAVRFPVDETTALHLHTGHVDPLAPDKAEPEVGPPVFLRVASSLYALPIVDEASPYGEDSSALTAFRFGQVLAATQQRNYATTARSSDPVLPTALAEIKSAFRLSLFLRLDSLDTGGDRVLIAGMPGRLGLYQQDATLRLRFYDDSYTWHDCQLVLTDLVSAGVWMLLEVQVSKDHEMGIPMWYVNGRVPPSTIDDKLPSDLGGSPDQLCLAHSTDLATDPDRYWQGALREVALTSEILWRVDRPTTDALMYARAMRLFGLAGEDLWQAGQTRRFEVEWQPGTRLLSEESLGLAPEAGRVHGDLAA